MPPKGLEVKNMKSLEFLHIRIEKELKDKIKEKAKEDNRTFSNWVLTVIKRELGH